MDRIATIRTWTRADLVAVLDGADRPDLAECLHARRLDLGDGATRGETALALKFFDAAELAAFMVIMGAYLGLDDGLRFASATTEGMPSCPDLPGTLEAYWPGWVLDEPTHDQWADEVTHCPGCEAADELCPAHAVAPWRTLGTEDPQPALALVQS